MALNALYAWQIRAIPPDHLLRDVFETCETFAEAKRRLEVTPIARPVIFTLVGCNEDERVVIERTERDHRTLDEDTCAANDWLLRRPSWEARVGADALFTFSSEEAAENSRRRSDYLAAWSDAFVGDFAWVTPPVLNSQTRVAVEMCPASGVLHAIGYERADGEDLPQPATEICQVAA